ncbi:MAG: helix-turn-helix transcriptional regulator, partial [Planctomycetes bacterium]|nr:helix-turn-helix transcriptional regulator [Planctomycetota bacterium]
MKWIESQASHDCSMGYDSIMLHYTNNGARRYDQQPVYIHQRKYWEFQAVLSGEIELCFFDRSAQIGSQRLWLIDPQCAHGWRSAQSTDAEIAVFHFDQVPQLLAEKSQAHDGVLSCDLSVVEIRQLRVLSLQAAEVIRDGQSEYQQLLIQHLNSDLSLRILRAYIEPEKSDVNSAENIVDRALAWYEAQLHEGPSYTMMAEAVYVSEAHLRRLFHQ